MEGGFFMANGYWVIRTYTAGAVGEKIKYWVPGEKPTKSERKIKSDIKQVQRNEANAEKALARLIHANFTPRDYLLQFSYTEEALEKLSENPDVRVTLLDIMLPGIDGFEVCRRVRAAYPHIGIIMLPARSQEMDKVTGLMTGADDYVTKPFSPAELTARVDALLRRAGDAPLVSAAVGEISQPPFLLNMTDRVVEKNGKRLKLTQLEYQIMKLFMENPDKALTREEILDTVWGRGYFGEVKIVDVNIRRLRLKIEDDAQEPRYIATVWGTGYKWSTD